MPNLVMEKIAFPLPCFSIAFFRGSLAFLSEQNARRMYLSFGRFFVRLSSEKTQ
jgi:hypothetical protein